MSGHSPLKEKSADDDAQVPLTCRHAGPDRSRPDHRLPEGQLVLPRKVRRGHRHDDGRLLPRSGPYDTPLFCADAVR